MRKLLPAVLFSAVFASAQSYTFTPLDVPNSNRTRALGVNNFDAVVGGYRDINLQWHSFFYSSGAYSTIDPPGAVDSRARGINGSGIIVGWFVTQPLLLTEGYMLLGNTYTTIDFPSPPATDSAALGISELAFIVGGYSDVGGVEHAFIRDGSGSFSDFDCLGALSFTEASGMNVGGVIVGGCDPDRPNGSIAFFRDADGTLTLFDFPGAVNTYAVGINDPGQIVGWFEDVDGFVHGFLREPGGRLPSD